jgi:TRAP-type mannitol/chloroaromatic compound transport system permease small subunit
VKALLFVSNLLNRILERIADWSGWLFVVLAVVICFDVFTRKVGLQVPGFESTRLQEMEWHLHTVMFSMWMGHCYLLNAHPRVDSFTTALPLRKKAWIELIGCLLFALPYCCVLVYYGIPFVRVSFVTNEISDAVTGLTHRWIIKGLFVLGLILLAAAVVSTILRLIVFLFGRDVAREVELPIERSSAPLV